MGKKNLNKLRSRMKELKYDIVLVQNPVDMEYLIGFHGTSATLFVTLSECYVLTDYRYYRQVLDTCEDVNVYDMAKEAMPFALYSRTAQLFENPTLAYDGSQLMESQITFFNQFTHNTEWVSYGTLLSGLRAVKSSEEVELIQKACEITDFAFGQILNIITPGMTEREVAVEIEYIMKKNGADQVMAYDMVVASGKRSSYAHGRATEKVIAKDDVVLFDFGCKYHEYCSDLSRTIFMGTATDKQKEVYNTVLGAQNAGINKAAPSVGSAEIDAAAREYCIGAGYGSQYGIGVGHGVGLTVAEAPTLIDVPGMFPSVPLQAGNIITVEPAIYIPNDFGVRIEDIILIGEEVNTNMVKANKDIIELNF